jgi:hypothetical protein
MTKTFLESARSSPFPLFRAASTGEGKNHSVRKRDAGAFASANHSTTINNEPPSSPDRRCLQTGPKRSLPSSTNANHHFPETVDATDALRVSRPFKSLFCAASRPLALQLHKRASLALAFGRDAQIDLPRPDWPLVSLSGHGVALALLRAGAFRGAEVTESIAALRKVGFRVTCKCLHWRVAAPAKTTHMLPGRVSPLPWLRGQNSAGVILAGKLFVPVGVLCLGRSCWLVCVRPQATKAGSADPVINRRGGARVFFSHLAAAAREGAAPFVSSAPPPALRPRCVRRSAQSDYNRRT